MGEGIYRSKATGGSGAGWQVGTRFVRPRAL